MQHYMNGRILLRPNGGVRRYASEVSDRLRTCAVLHPRSAGHPWSARVWEQTTLARRSADGVLLNVAHSGPIAHRRHVFVVHDLLALSAPGSVRAAYSRLLRVQLPRLIAGARMVVAVSRSVADEVAGTFDVAADRLSVVPPGVSDVFGPGDRARARARIGLDPDRPVVGALLDPTPRKNSSQVVALLDQVRRERPSVQIAVAGGTGTPAFAKRSPDSATRPTGFKDLGAVSDARLSALYQSADIFVSLSDAEGFGLPVVEAAASGSAVVSTAVPSVVEHARDGAVVVGGAADAYQQVVALLDDPLRRSELAERAREQVSHLRWDRTAHTLGAILDEVGRS